jgi:hypothetical protein
MLVEVEKPRQVLDHVARRRFAAGEEAHDLGIAIKVEQVIRLGEPAQRQAPGRQEDVHPSVLPTAGQTRAA